MITSYYKEVMNKILKPMILQDIFKFCASKVIHTKRIEFIQHNTKQTIAAEFPWIAKSHVPLIPYPSFIP
jgi:predicted patatin/cPLA2 family phospholipase